LDICSAGGPSANIANIVKKPKTKYRPVPLDTIELEKLAVRKLRITAKRALAAAEKLYTSGFISYPRTETNIFPKDINLAELIQTQSGSSTWGAFATDIINHGGANPRNGTKSDAAHPPIHPLKLAGQ
jgi:DNA topoisomerase-3